MSAQQWVVEEADIPVLGPDASSTAERPDEVLDEGGIAQCWTR